jgi:hypothetical protein
MDFENFLTTPPKDKPYKGKARLVNGNLVKPEKKPRKKLEKLDENAIIKWCKSQGYRAVKIPNELAIYNPTAIPREQKGFVDLLVFGNKKILFIELKKSKGGRVSPEQIEWQQYLQSQGHITTVAHGYDEAVEFIKNKIK